LLNFATCLILPPFSSYRLTLLHLTAVPQQPQQQYAVTTQMQREPHGFTNPQYGNPPAYTEYTNKDTKPLM